MRECSTSTQDAQNVSYPQYANELEYQQAMNSEQPAIDAPVHSEKPRQDPKRRACQNQLPQRQQYNEKLCSFNNQLLNEVQQEDIPKKPIIATITYVGAEEDRKKSQKAQRHNQPDEQIPDTRSQRNQQLDCYQRQLRLIRPLAQTDLRLTSKNIDVEQVVLDIPGTHPQSTVKINDPEPPTETWFLPSEKRGNVLLKAMDSRKANSSIIEESRSKAFKSRYSKDSQYQRQLSKSNIKDIASGKSVKFVQEDDLDIPKENIIDCTSVENSDSRRTFPLRNADPRVPLPIDYAGLQAQKKRTLEQKYEIVDEEPDLEETKRSQLKRLEEDEQKFLNQLHLIKYGRTHDQIDRSDQPLRERLADAQNTKKVKRKQTNVQRPRVEKTQFTPTDPSLIQTVNGYRNANVYAPEWLTASGFGSSKMPLPDEPIEETMLKSVPVGANNCYGPVDHEKSEDGKPGPMFKYIDDGDPYLSKFEEAQLSGNKKKRAKYQDNSSKSIRRDSDRNQMQPEKKKSMVLDDSNRAIWSANDWINTETYVQESKDQRKTRQLALQDRERGARGFSDYRDEVELAKLSRKERRELLMQQEDAEEQQEDWPEIEQVEYKPSPEFSMAQYQNGKYSEDTENRMCFRNKHGFTDSFDNAEGKQLTQKEIASEKLDEILHQRELATSYIGYGDSEKIWSKQRLLDDPRTPKEQQQQQQRKEKQELQDKARDLKKNFEIIERKGEVKQPQYSVQGYGGVPTYLDFDPKKYSPDQFQY